MTKNTASGLANLLLVVSVSDEEKKFYKMSTRLFNIFSSASEDGTAGATENPPKWAENEAKEANQDEVKALKDQGFSK